MAQIHFPLKANVYVTTVEFIQMIKAFVIFFIYTFILIMMFGFFIWLWLNKKLLAFTVGTIWYDKLNVL